MTRYRKTMTEAYTKVKELSEAKYRYDGKVVFISKAEFKKIAKDYKNATPGQERMVVLDPKTQATVSAPVKFEEFDLTEGDHEISMARGELEAIADKALKLSSMLQGKTDDAQLEAWVQSKITKAKDYINSVTDYMEYNPDMNEAKTVCPKCNGEGCEHCDNKGYHITEIKQTHSIVDKDNKVIGTYSSEKDAQNALKTSHLIKMHGGVKVVNKYKNIGQVIEEVELEESFSDAQIAKLKKEYEPLRNKKISVDNANKLGAMFTKFDKDKNALEKLYGGDIPFISTMAMTRLMTKHNYKAADLKKIRKESVELADELEMLDEAQMLNEAEATIHVSDKKKQDNLVHLCKQVGIKTTVSGNKVHLKGIFRRVMDISLAMQRNGLKVEEKGKDDAYAIGMAQAKKMTGDEKPLKKSTIKKGHEIAKSIMKDEQVEHPAKMKYEQIKGLKNKAEKSGMPYSILKKVYDRGMAAWRGGHRPGASQQQWAFARVNSFVTKSSGTWGGADKDLAAKVRGSK